MPEVPSNPEIEIAPAAMAEDPRAVSDLTGALLTAESDLVVYHKPLTVGTSA